MREGEGMFKEKECPSCKREMKKEIEPNGQGGFYYIFICPIHGLMERRHPTIAEIEGFNQ